MLCIPHIKLTILQRRFLRFRCGHLVRSLFAGPLVQINSTILRQFLKRLHYDGIASCIGIDHWVTYNPLCFVWCSDFQAFHFSYDLVIFKLSFPLTHAAWHMVGCRVRICHEPQVIQLQSCEGQTYYTVSRLFLNFCCPLLPCIIWRPACHMEYSRALQSASRSVRYATSCAT